MPADRTEAQKAASRANGRKSRGATSDAGRSRSALNHVKHGILAASLLLPGESEKGLNAINLSVTSEFKPRTEMERTLVQCMVAALWRLRRIWSLEQAALIMESANSSSPETAVTPEGTWHIPAARAAAAFQSVHSRLGSGSALHMAEARYQRQLTQALQQFRSLRTNHPAAEYVKNEIRP